jgi:cytochrome c553
MKKVLGLGVLLGTAVVAITAIQAAEQQQQPLQKPEWAYGIPPPRAPGEPAPPPVRDDGKLFSLPGAEKQFTLNQIRGRRDNDTPARTQPADWYPNEHPAMPKIVAEGDESRGIIACSLCHYPNGKGRSENASPAGLPKEYITRQLHNMRDNLRASAERRKANSQAMVSFAKAMTEQEIQESAAYFAAMQWTPWVNVIESDTAPKVRSAGGLMIPLEGAEGGMEPIGNRIVEVPVNPEHTETLRNPRSSFIAYVPMGAVAKGKELVTTGGGGKTIQCTLCHGENLNGVGSVPGIAARSPSYNARQLNDIRQGARHGDMAELMKGVVAKLTDDDILNITAYLASLPAPATVAYQKSANAQ